MARKEYTPRKSLRDEKVDKIIGEGTGSRFIRITVEHQVGDKEPIILEVQGEWYGDIIERYRTLAESYFNIATLLELEREIGLTVLDMTTEIIQEQERRSDEEIRLRMQQIRSQQIVAAGTPEERIETESMAAGALGDYRQPIPVREAIYKDPGTIHTVYGQITAMNKPIHKIKGGMYQCNRCQGLQYIQYQRPSDVGDAEAPEIVHRMCRYCEELNLSQNTPEYRQATELHFRDPRKVDARWIELTETEEFDRNDTLPVWLFGEHAQNARVGEYVVIRGKIYSDPTSRSPRSVYHAVFYAHDIKYTNKTTYELTDKDVKRIKRFVELAKQEKEIIHYTSINKEGKEEEKKTKLGEPLGEKNIIHRLAWMYGHHIPQCWNAKQALLFAEASAGPDMIGRGSKKFRRSRINVGLVGAAGLLKSSLLRCVLQHDERNQYETAQSMSGKTMSAIVTREAGDNSTPVLRTGALAHTKEAVLCVNEFAELSLEEQKYFQDSWEEGQFTVNKMGMHAIIRADCVGIWTGNPKQGSSFSNNRSISLDEINVRKQILDRTDLLIVLKEIEDEEQDKTFNDLLLESEFWTEEHKKIVRNYDEYIKIHSMYAKRNIKPKLTVEAKEIISESDIRIKRQKRQEGVPNAGSHRGLGVLLRLATVIAKLKLHQEITAEDAREAAEFYNRISSDIQTSTVVPSDPGQTAVGIMEFILQNESGGLAKRYTELCELASAKDQSVKWYLFQGAKNNLGNVSTNRAARRVLELLENISANKIKRTKLQPAEFLWVGGKDEEEDEDKEEGDIKGKGTEVIEQESEKTRQADVYDVADKAKGSRIVEKQTKMSSHQDKTESKGDVQPHKSVSATSQTSAINCKIPLEEKEDKVLMACGMAMADYNKDKVERKESGALFTTYGVWYHMQHLYPDENWTEKKVHRVLESLVKKGRVLTRHGDAPDRWCLIVVVEGDGEGGESQ